MRYTCSAAREVSKEIELRLTAKCKLREMEVGRSPEKAESTRPVKDTALACVVFFVVAPLRLVGINGMGALCADGE